MSSSAKPLISILIPVYNMGEFIEDAIASVLRGVYECIEIQIVDDGSTDNTKQILLPYVTQGSPKFDCRVNFTSKANGGKSSALNLGLKLCQGDFIAILDADDEFSERGFSSRSELALSHKHEKCMIIGGFEVFEERVAVGRRPIPNERSANVLRKKFYFSLKTPFHLNSCLLSRPLVDSVGVFDEELIRCQDGDYAIRCLQKTQQIYFTEEIVYRYRKHRSSIRDRVIFRLRTAFHRTKVLRKNFTGFQRITMIIGCLFMDVLKLTFEIFGNFKR